MCGPPPPHHYILGLVSTLKCDGVFTLKTFMHGSPPLQFYIDLLVVSVSTLKCDYLFMYGSPPPDHFFLDSLSIFKYDDLSVLEHLCILSTTSKNPSK